MASYMFLFVLIGVSQSRASSKDDRLPTIAIVGGGIGGASCAHHLRLLFGPKLPISVFESDQIGGRARVVSFAGMEFEAGGSVIHPHNKEMVSFLESLGLEKIEQDSDGVFAFYDGVKISFESSRYNILTSIKMLWRYGWQLFTLKERTSAYLKEFGRIYGWQQELQAFSTVPNILLSMADTLLNATQHQLRRVMLDEGFSDLFIDELVAAAAKVNYGQTPFNLHSFVGMVGLAGMDSDLWSVRGGNYLIAKGLLKVAAASVVAERVRSVDLVPGDGSTDEWPRYKLTTSQGTRLFDIVVLAVPFVEGSEDNIELLGFVHDIATKIARPYKRIVSTFVKGKPNFKRFGYSSASEFPSAIFVTRALFFNSLTLQAPVNATAPAADVYKVFSPEELTEAQLNELFMSREAVTSVTWNAYPLYSPEAFFPPIVLHDQLFYANAIETAASAMEMAAISGRNIAQLAYNRWLSLDHLVDNMFVIEEKHIKMEL